MGFSFRLTARVLLYAPSHRQDSTYHGVCYTSCGALAGTRNSSMGPPYEGSIRRPITPFLLYIKLSLRLRQVYYLFVFVALICFVLTKIFLSKIFILHCLVLLNSVLLKPCLFRYICKTYIQKSNTLLRLNIYLPLPSIYINKNN